MRQVKLLISASLMCIISQTSIGLIALNLFLNSSTLANEPINIFRNPSVGMAINTFQRALIAKWSMVRFYVREENGSILALTVLANVIVILFSKLFSFKVFLADFPVLSRIPRSL